MEILSPFREFSRSCKAENFRLDLPTPRRCRGSAIATEPTMDRRQRPSRIENPRIVSSADRESRLHPRRWAFPPARGPGSHKIKIPSAFCEFSRPCKAENFRFGRNEDLLIPATDARPLPETTGSPRSHAVAHCHTRTRGDAGLVASI
jgi:hypothetical protein